MMASDHSLFDEIDDAAEDAADTRAMADLEAGRVVSHAAVKAWLLSWGRADELPPPQVGD